MSVYFLLCIFAWILNPLKGSWRILVRSVMLTGMSYHLKIWFKSQAQSETLCTFGLIDPTQSSSAHHGLAVLHVSANVVVHISCIVSWFMSLFSFKFQIRMTPKMQEGSHNAVELCWASSADSVKKLKYFPGFQATNQPTQLLVSGEIVSSKRREEKEGTDAAVAMVRFPPALSRLQL